MERSLTLVTGGTGFLGSHLLRQLVADGRRVRALRRAGSSLAMVPDIAGRIEWAEGDVNDLPSLEAAFDGATHVFHCAAMVSFFPKQATNMLKINAEGTANVVNFALAAGVRKLVHVSSIAAVGRTKERPHLVETAKWVNGPMNSAYAISKHLAEQEAWRGHFEGLPTAIVNPSVILGAGDWASGTPHLFRQVHDGLKFWPTGQTGFVDVRDVARFMRMLMDSDIAGERFLLNAENRPFRWLFDKIAASLGTPGPKYRAGPLLAEIAWRAEWLKSALLGSRPLVTRDTARASVSAFSFGNEKSRSVFGFEYRPLESTIEETARLFLEAAAGGGSFGPRFFPGD